MDWLISVCVIAALILAARAFFRTRALTATILALRATVEVLDQRLSRLEDPPPSLPLMSPVETPAAEAPVPEKTVGGSTPVDAQIAAPPLVPAGKGWEEILVENWLVWLGVGAGRRLSRQIVDRLRPPDTSGARRARPAARACPVGRRGVDRVG